jgi:putative peptidoglycan lipid II flippase
MYGLTPILYTLGTIAGTLFLTPVYGATGPMLGTIAGALIYALLRLVAVWRAGFRFQWVVWHPEFSSMLPLMLPRVLSLGALQLQLLVFDTLGSGLAQGAISINLASRNFQSVGVGIVGIALAQAVYSPLSQAAARSDVTAYTMYLRKALLYALSLTIPGAVLLVVLAPIAAQLVDLTQVYPVFRTTLFFYALSIPFESMNHLLLRGYYALKDTLLPAFSTVVAGVAAMLTAWLLVPQFGVFALAIGFTAGQLVQTLGLGMFLSGRLERRCAIRGQEHLTSSSPV